MKTDYKKQTSLVLSLLFAALLSTGLIACNRSTDKPNPNASVTMGTEIDDAVLTSKVRSAMVADEYVKSLDVKVETFKAEVMLSGFVETQAQMDRSVEVAKSVQGVRSVNNKLSLKSSTQTVGAKIDDSVITAAVKAAMMNDPVMKSREVSVVTVNGQVQLSGFVDSDKQVTQAYDVATKVEGVVGVLNQLSVKK